MTALKGLPVMATYGLGYSDGDATLLVSAHNFGSLASNLLNLVLDPLLIFGARMGVAGAALAGPGVVRACVAARRLKRVPGCAPPASRGGSRATCRATHVILARVRSRLVSSSILA